MGNKNYKYFFALNKRKSIKKISDKEINKFGKGGGGGGNIAIGEETYIYYYCNLIWKSIMV